MEIENRHEMTTSSTRHGHAEASNRHLRLVEIGIALSAERDHDRLMERILLEAKGLCNADGGTLYLRTPEDTLKFAIMRTASLGIALGGTTGKPIAFPSLRMYGDDGRHGRL